MTEMANKREELKGDFDRDGFVVIKGFLNASDLTEVQRELERYIVDRIPRIPRTDVYYEVRDDASTLKQMARIKEHDPFFANLIARRQWTGLAEHLLDDKVEAKELEWFDKPPQLGKATPPHQDGYYFMLKPNEAVTMWLALDPVDQDNGCMRYIPGSHRKGLRPHGSTGVLGFSQGIADYSSADRHAEVAVSAAPGDLLVHHAMTIHRADGNLSFRHRRSLGLIFYSASAQQDVDTLSAYQSDLNVKLRNNNRI
jgi:phytanoyl-CoA hydroxylase